MCSNSKKTKQISLDNTTLPVIKYDVSSSFLPPNVIKKLSKYLDYETVYWEFNEKRKIVLEEVMRIIGDYQPIIKISRRNSVSILTEQPNGRRLFYRQSARFELLNSQSLIGLKPLDYLGHYVYINDTRKIIFGRTFNKYYEETNSGSRYLLSSRIIEALNDVMGRILMEKEVVFLKNIFGEVYKRLDFRTWCGVCAFAERSIPELSHKEEDPPPWLERVDFAMLEQRLHKVQVDEKLMTMLRLIRDR